MESEEDDLIATLQKLATRRPLSDRFERELSVVVHGASRDSRERMKEAVKREARALTKQLKPLLKAERKAARAQGLVTTLLVAMEHAGDPRYTSLARRKLDDANTELEAADQELQDAKQASGGALIELRFWEALLEVVESGAGRP